MTAGRGILERPTDFDHSCCLFGDSITVSYSTCVFVWRAEPIDRLWPEGERVGVTASPRARDATAVTGLTMLKYSPDSRPLARAPFVSPTNNGTAGSFAGRNDSLPASSRDEAGEAGRERAMPKFMFLYRSASDCAPNRSPEEMQRAMQEWGEWIEGGFAAGWLLDAGDGLKPGGKVLHPDGTVTDGPFAESKELVGGYCMIEAADLEAAVEIGKSMPETGGAIELRELAGHAIE